MTKALASIRRRLDAVPLWAVGLLNLGILAVWMADWRLPDPLPGIDEVLVTGILVASAVYTWRRLFGPPSSLAAEARRRLAEVEILHDEIVKAAAAAGVAGEVSRIKALLEGIRKIEGRIEQAEIVLASPQYARAAAEAEVRRLDAEVARATDGAKANLAAAHMEAQRHLENIDQVRATRDELSAAFERTFQIIRRIHSQVIGIGLSRGSKDDLSSSVDELAKTIDDMEKERLQQERAEKQVDAELEADRLRAAAAKKNNPTTH